jgi:O-antigen/teichoic acid export membrane protein
MKRIPKTFDSVRTKIRAISSQSLLRNAFFLMLSTAITAGIGFLFWNICSRSYSPEEVGLATTLISATALISTLSMWGFNNTIISFLPKSKDMRLANMAFAGVSLSSLVFGALFILLASQFDPNLPEIMSQPWEKAVVLAYVMAQSLNMLTDSLFIAKRNTKYILLKNSVSSVAKLILPWMLISLAGFGIFMSIAAVTFISLAISAYNILKQLHYIPRFELQKEQFQKVRTFTLENYIGNIFGILPTTLVPLSVSWILGKEQVAYLYIALTISALLNVIPSATSQSFFAEASHHGTDAKHLLAKAFKHVYAILVPAVIILTVGGGLLLDIFGKAYSASSFHVLQLLAVASLFGVINYLGDTYLNVLHRTKAYIFMNALNAIAVVGFSIIGMHRYGLIGVGYGWLAGQIFTNIAYACLMSVKKTDPASGLEPVKAT